MKTIKVYFDYKSPYAYLAMDSIFSIEKDFDLNIEWKPWTLAISDTYGNLETRSETEWFKVKYLYLHARRLANQQNRTLLGPKRIFSGEIAAHGALLALDQGKFKPYHKKVYELFFERKLDLDDINEVSTVLKSVDIDTSGFTQFIAEAGKAKLQNIREEAKADQVFGIPSIILDDELFWGNESIPFLRKKLQSE